MITTLKTSMTVVVVLAASVLQLQSATTNVLPSSIDIYNDIANQQDAVISQGDWYDIGKKVFISIADTDSGYSLKAKFSKKRYAALNDYLVTEMGSSKMKV